MNSAFGRGHLDPFPPTVHGLLVSALWLAQGGRARGLHNQLDQLSEYGNRSTHAATNHPTVLTLATGSTFSWTCLMQNWALGVVKHGMPHSEVVIVALDHVALADCHALRLHTRRPFCVNGTEYGVQTDAYAEAIARAHGTQPPTEKYRAYQFAKLGLIHAATSSGFAIVYVDMDIIFFRALPAARAEPRVFEMQYANGGLIVAPARSELVARWHAMARNASCHRAGHCARDLTDQGPLIEALRAFPEVPRTVYPGHYREGQFVAECGVLGPHGTHTARTTAVGIHYNCISGSMAGAYGTAEQRMNNLGDEARVVMKAARMRSQGQWLVRHGTCAAYGTLPAGCSRWVVNEGMWTVNCTQPVEF